MKIETWNKVRDALIVQGRQSFDGEACLYRGPEGTKCAVGHLIPDELYHSGMESMNVHEIICEREIEKCLLTYPRRSPNHSPYEVDNLKQMQKIHDNYEKECGDFSEYIRREFDTYLEHNAYRFD